MKCLKNNEYKNKKGDKNIYVNFLKKNEIAIPRLLQRTTELFKLQDCDNKFLNAVLIP